MTDLKRHSMSLFQLLSAAYCSLWRDLLTSSSFIFIIYVYKELLFFVLSSVLLKCPIKIITESGILKENDQSIFQININQVLQFNSNWPSGFRED
jgi:hypothetical protein